MSENEQGAPEVLVADDDDGLTETQKYPAAVTDPSELPQEKPRLKDGNDQDASDLPPLDDEAEVEDADGS